MRTKNIFIALVLMVAAVLLSMPMATAQNLTPKVHPKSGLFGYWGTKKNGKGAFIIKPKFDRAERFVNGHAFVSVNGAWYVIGNDGKALLSTTYSKVSALSDDHYRVRQGDKYGVVDLRSLAEILPIKYDAINILDGKYELTINGKHGLADKSGAEILPIMYDAINIFDGKYRLTINGKHGLVDKAGTEILPIMYDAISALGNAYKVAIGNKYGIVDSENKEIIPIKYDAINTFDGKYKLTIDGKHGLADKAGTEILPIKYDAIRTLGNAYEVTIGDKCGIVDKTNKVIVEPQYKAVESVDGGLYALFSDKWIFVDSSGEEVDISDRVMHYSTNNGQKLTKYPSCQNLFCDEVGVLFFTNAPTSIGESVFEDCRSLTSITIPHSVTEIGYRAFYGCSSLTDVTTPEQWIGYAVNNISGLKRINGKEIIRDGSFIFLEDTLVWVDRNLESVSIPASVKSIAPTAFKDCTKIENVNVPDLNLWLCSGVDMSDCGSWNLYHNGKLVTNVTIPNGVTKITDGQFRANKSLTSITIPNSVTSIGGSAFCGCSRLDSITIPASVKEIGESAFYSCSSLTSVTISNGVTEIGGSAFCVCSSLRSITIPASVKEIGESAFYSCSSLTSVTISNGVTEIGDCAFKDCTSLTSVTIGDSVTKIGDKAFYDCNSLGSITIPASVTYIGDDVFTRHEDRGTLYIYMNSATPPALGGKFLNYSFYWSSGDPYYSSTRAPIIYVPESALFDYRSADVWKYMTDRIYPR